MNRFFISIALCIVSALAIGLISSQHKVNPPKASHIGLLVVATGKYSTFIPQLLESADRFFCPCHKVTYFVFTDQKLPEHPRLITIHQAQLGWPYDSLMRFSMYRAHKDQLASCDYLFSCDADMHFEQVVGDEILSDRVATQHPQLRFARGIYETNPLSTAAVARAQGSAYVAGAFYGGTREEFFTLLDTIHAMITTDLARGYIARVNDESYLNKYFVEHPPTCLLSPSYCHFDSWHSPYERKLVALDKHDHEKKDLRARPVFNPLGWYVKLLRNELESVT